MFWNAINDPLFGYLQVEIADRLYSTMYYIMNELSAKISRNC